MEKSSVYKDIFTNLLINTIKIYDFLIFPFFIFENYHIKI